MDRFAAPLATGVATALAVVYLLFVGEVGLLLIAAAVGAPITVLLLADALAAPVGRDRSLVPSFLIGATLVPALVIAANGVFVLAAFLLVTPFAELLRDLGDALRADPELLEILASPWAFFFILELAVVAPLAEESLKPLGALMRRPATARDAFLFGAAAGAGFAAIENVLYASGWFWSFDGWLPISLLRLPGAALHPLGAGLVALGWYRLQRGGGVAQLARRYAAAVAIHGIWNGTIAVTIVLYADRARIGEGLAGTSLAWGTALALFLAGYGALLLAALLGLARSLRAGDESPRLFGEAAFGQPAVVGAWAIVTGALLLPVAVLILVFPDFLAL